MSFLLTAGVSFAAPNPLLDRAEAGAVFDRALQLMESTTLTVPGLARTAEPLIENATQARRGLKAAGEMHPAFTYALMENVNAYLVLADALPKPPEASEAGLGQFAELREVEARLYAHFRALLDDVQAQMTNPDRDDLHRYQEDNARIGRPNPNNPRVVFFGDSITDFWRLNEYFPDSDFINRGISGQITGEMLGRMKADVIDLEPKAVVILAGTNDIARGVAPDAIRNNLEMICELAKVHDIKVILSSVLPVHNYNKAVDPHFERTPDRPLKTILELNDWIHAYCQRNRHTYLDYYPAMEDDNGFLKQDMADDGLHPNAAGYRVMAPLVWNAIMSVVPQPQGPRRR